MYPRIKTSRVTRPSESEKLALEKLSEIGIVAKHMPFKYKYDIETNGGLKIEVKHRTKGKMVKGTAHAHIIVSNIKIIDFVVVIIGKIDNPVFYIIPSNKKQQNYSFSMNPVSKSKNQINYLEKWNLIKKAELGLH